MSLDSNKELIKVGVCFDEFLEELLEVEKHDVKLDFIITDKTIMDF